jgi:hypothetical protein
MALSVSINSKDSIAAETIAAQLDHEPGLPAAQDLDVDLVKHRIVALDLKLRSKALDRLAPEVLDKLRNMEYVFLVPACRVYTNRHTAESLQTRQPDISNATLSSVILPRPSIPGMAVALRGLRKKHLSKVPRNSSVHGRSSARRETPSMARKIP